MIAQPIDQVEWVERDRLVANDYNPNHVAPPEYALLRQSLLEDGWTQPIVVRDADAQGQFEIVDGYHRWSVAADPDVLAPTDGKVPIVRLRADASRADQMLATVRHNRARGQHTIVRMAAIVRALQAAGVSTSDIETRLGMELEEIERLADERGMPQRVGGNGFNAGWVPG